MFQLLEFYHARLLLVVKVEHSSDPILGPDLPRIRAHNIHKLFERQLLIGLPQRGHNMNNILISPVKSKLLQNFTDLHWIDDSATVLVKDQEGLSEEFVVLGGDAVAPFGGGLFGGLGTGGRFCCDGGHYLGQVL